MSETKPSVPSGPDGKLNIDLLRNLVRWAAGQNHLLDEGFYPLKEFSHDQEVWGKQYINVIDTETGRFEDWYVAGAELLGITDEEARQLFFADNSIEEIIDISKRIAHDHGYTL